jgi:hypothetical protein
MEITMSNKFARTAATLSLLFSLAVSGCINAGIPGARLTDGTVLAGMSPDTKTPMYTTPADAPGLYRWQEAQAYCETLNAHGHNDWRTPSRDELKVLYNNRVTIRDFKTDSGTGPHAEALADWYWSSTSYPEQAGYAWDQSFHRKNRAWVRKDIESSLRCVRS